VEVSDQTNNPKNETSFSYIDGVKVYLPDAAFAVENRWRKPSLSQNIKA
jgi:hypothetical protein